MKIKKIKLRIALIMSVILILCQSLVVLAGQNDYFDVGMCPQPQYGKANTYNLVLYSQRSYSSGSRISDDFQYITLESDYRVCFVRTGKWSDTIQYYDTGSLWCNGENLGSYYTDKSICTYSDYSIEYLDGNIKYTDSGTSKNYYNGYSHINIDCLPNEDGLLEYALIYTDVPVFDSEELAKIYMETGDMTGAVITPTERELTQNNFIGFNDFKARRTIDPYLFGGNGVLVTYTLPSNYEELLSDNAKLMFDVTFTTQVKGSKLMSNVFVDNGYWNDKYTVQITEPITGSSGQITFDYMSLLLESGAYTGSDGLALTALMYEADNQYDTGKFLASNVLSVVDNGYGTNLTDILESNEYIGLMSLECNIVAYIQDGYEVGKKSYGYVDLVDGANQSVTDVPDVMNEDETITENGSKSESNLNDMKKDTDSFGSPIYTEVTGSSNSNSSAEVVNNVIFPSDITVTVIGGSYGSSSNNPDYDITIEDDDYTDTELRNDLKDGFGMFDDVTTDKENDGFLNMLSGIFAMIDPELGDILSYGVSTAVVVSLLRLMFKR